MRRELTRNTLRGCCMNRCCGHRHKEQKKHTSEVGDIHRHTHHKNSQDESSSEVPTGREKKRSRTFFSNPKKERVMKDASPKRKFNPH